MLIRLIKILMMCMYVCNDILSRDFAVGGKVLFDAVNEKCFCFIGETELKQPRRGRLNIKPFSLTIIIVITVNIL